MTDSPQHDALPPEGGGLDGYRARYDYHRGLGMDHNAAQRAASNKGADPSGASDRPPKRPGGGRGAGAPGGGKRTTGVARTVREMVSTVGGTVAMFDPYSGGILIERAPDLGAACAKAADHDARFRRALEGFAAGGVYGGLMVVALSILVPIAARWGLIPEPYGSRLAVALAPESMREQVAQQMAQQQAQQPAPEAPRV